MTPTAEQIREALRGPLQELTLSEAARLTGVARPSISQWLAGRRGLPLDQLDALAAACGLELVVKARKVKG